MYQYWIILSFATLGCLSQNYSVTEISTSSGLYYEKIGDVLLSNEKWEFVTAISYANYRNFYKYLHMQAQKIEEFCQDQKSSECEGWFRGIQTRLNSIDGTDVNMAHFLGIKSQKRRQRRFWNSIPDFLSSLERATETLFGNDNQPNLNVYDDQIAKLQSRERELEHKAAEQKTFFLVDAEKKTKRIRWLEESQRKIKTDMEALKADSRKHEKKIIELDRMLNEVKTELGKLNKLAKNIRSIKSEISRIDNAIGDLSASTQLSLLSSSLVHLLDLFENEQNKLYDVIKKANKGELDPYVLTPLNLIEMLQEIQGQLGDGQQFPFHPSVENAHKLYNIIKIKVYLHNGQLIFIMTIPLVKNKRFGIHKMTSMPAAFGPNRFLFILPQEPFLIVDSEYHEYLLMSHSNFKGYCQDIEVNLYLCNQVDHLSRAGRDDNCEMQLFSTALETPHSCHIRVMEIKRTMFLQLQEWGTWIYAAKADDSIVIACDVGQKNIALRGSGFLRLPGTCHGRTGALKLEPLLEFTKPVVSNFTADFNLTDYLESFDIIHLEMVPFQMTCVIPPYRFDLLEGGSIALKGSSGNMTWLYILSSIIILLLIVTIGYFIYKKKIDVKIFRNQTRFVPMEASENPDDRMKVKVKLDNKDKRITNVLMHANPSSHDPQAEYLTVRFKVKTQKMDERVMMGIMRNETMSEEDEFLTHLRKLKPNHMKY